MSFQGLKQDHLPSTQPQADLASYLQNFGQWIDVCVLTQITRKGKTHLGGSYAGGWRDRTKVVWGIHGRRQGHVFGRRKARGGDSTVLELVAVLCLL